MRDHPDPADHDDMVPAVKKRMNHRAQGIKPHMRLDKKASGGATTEKWIQSAVPASHKGMLHKALGVPEGEKIPAAKLDKAANSSSSHVRHMAQFAKNVP